ncbi:unnamed protein product [Rotaria magnacalcarata]|uniref:Reverse transcriptase domain-containing protein n=1 Tax=Rotaria magnacalcarata TaxID=392030 RepID=A0A816XKY4_9BILA|nr:unnamed protein product [Rotaria magnacalcarata]
MEYTTLQILRAIKLCCTGAKFEFKGKYYLQIFGMQMGSGLSSILANLFMEFFETNMAHPVIDRFLLWKRYVDDAYAIIPRDANTEDLARELSSIIPSINFTFEEEVTNTLPFLDVLVINDGDRLKFKIYRKETNNHLIINKYSMHTNEAKNAALTAMYLRALKIVSPEFLDAEFKIIEEIGTKTDF